MVEVVVQSSHQHLRWQSALPCSHPLCGTVCWVECWSSRAETSGRLHPASSSWPTLEHVCTPRNSDALRDAHPAASLAPPPPLEIQRHILNLCANANTCPLRLHMKPAEEERESGWQKKETSCQVGWVFVTLTTNEHESKCQREIKQAVADLMPLNTVN